MKYFCQYYTHTTYKDALIPMGGSDGVLVLDGRKSISNMIKDIEDQIHRARALNKDFAAYTIERSIYLFSRSYTVYTHNPTTLQMKKEL